MVVLEKSEKKLWLIEMSCPLERNVEEKEKEKNYKYRELAEEMKTLFPGCHVEVVPLVIGCLGGINNIVKNIHQVLQCKEEDAARTVTEMQRATLISSARMWTRIAS